MNEAQQVKDFVQRKIGELNLFGSDSATKATLARLRRGIGKQPGSIPQLWAVTLEGMPESLMGKGDSPSRGEWAAYTALTLFALHQQGKDVRTQCMNRSGDRLGGSIRRLVRDPDDEVRVKRRFDTVATATNMQEIAHHLRGVVQLLRDQDIALDYPALAEDLYRFQSQAEQNAVRLRWGRDYYRTAEVPEQGANEMQSQQKG